MEKRHENPPEFRDLTKTKTSDVNLLIFWFLQVECRCNPIVPECVARVPVSLWRCGGRAVFTGRCVYVRNRPQPSATVRVRTVWPCLLKVLQKGSLLELSKELHFAWQAWQIVAFQYVSRRVRSRFVWQAQFEDALHFSWQAQHFGHLRCHFAWHAQKFGRVVLRVF